MVSQGDGSQINSSMSQLQNMMDEAFNEITKKRLSYEEWCIKKDTEKRLKHQLTKDTKIELHNELARTLEEALQRKRKGDEIVNEWIKSKTKESKKTKREKSKELAYKKHYETLKARSNSKVFTDWLRKNLKSLRREKSQK